jgi:hypothetical protein
MRMGRQKRQRGRQAIIALAILLPALLSACGANLSAGQAGAAREALAAELQHAQAIGVAPAVVAGLAAQEQHIDGERGWFGIADDQAAARYGAVLAQVRQSETDATATAESAASADLNALYAAVQRGINTQIAPSSFMTRWQTWQSDFARAVTPGDFNHLDQQIRADLAMMDAMNTAHDRLAEFSQAVAGMRHAGLPVALESAELQQAQASFAQGTTAADFTHLTAILDAQSVGLVTDQVQAIPYLGSALLDDLQARIALAQGYGANVAPFQSALATDRRALVHAQTLVDYLNLKTKVDDQAQKLSFLLVRGQTQADLAQLRALLAYCRQHGIMDYEYVTASGLQGAEQDFAASTTAAQYQYVDGETTMLLANLRAMITNLGDPTPANQPHLTDLDLARAYGVAQGKVIVVSLREQVLRAYDNGQLISWTYITSGRPELPSPPGFWHVLARQSPTIFTSSEPKNSPFWYAPTLVHYALLYHAGGFYIHDAWWRIHFGPGSNLPHYDPQAFNGGSHGCVNVPLQQMALLYQWATLGTPVIVY